MCVRVKGMCKGGNRGCERDAVVVIHAPTETLSKKRGSPPLYNWWWVAPCKLVGWAMREMGSGSAGGIGPFLLPASAHITMYKLSI